MSFVRLGIGFFKNFFNKLRFSILFRIEGIFTYSKCRMIELMNLSLSLIILFLIILL